MVDGKVRPSSRSTSGRKRRRSTGDEVRTGRGRLRHMGVSPGLKMRLNEEIRKSASSASSLGAQTSQGLLREKAMHHEVGRRPCD
jgi:hypothetical protein